ncbi:unnamed protein product [Closterium sp. Naga37s-1]|nr:unnamed protein product [Closterium sp. Naga37s-1]
MARNHPAVAMLLMTLGAMLLAAQPSGAIRAWLDGEGFQPLEAPASGGSGGNGGSGSVYIVRLSSAPPLVEYRGGIAGYPATATWDDDRSENDGGDDESVPNMDLSATDVVAGADTAPSRAAKHEAVELEDSTTPSTADGAADTAAVDAWSSAFSGPNVTAFSPAVSGDVGNDGRARRRMRLSMDRPQVAAFATLLQRQKAQVASEAGVLDADLIYSYKHTSNGFAARLTARQVWRLQRHPDVTSVTPSRMLRPQTTDSPKFLGLPGKVWPAVGAISSPIRPPLFPSPRSTIARGVSLASATSSQSLNPLNAIASATASSNSTGDSSATLTADGGITFTAASSAPMVAEFSSRGPLLPPSDTARPPLPANDILKPDIIGPGVDLVAAFPSKKIGEPGTTARLTALMTTARFTDTSNSPIKNAGAAGKDATPWDMGAGHVFPPAMLDPGLTYDAREKDYQNFLAGQDLNRAKKEFPGASLSPLAVRNLNLPTITVPRLQGTVLVTRTVTCVGSSVSTYTVFGKAPPGVQLPVGPGSFTLAPGQKATYMVKLMVDTPSNDFKYGYIAWKDDKGHTVRSPLVVRPISR